MNDGIDIFSMLGINIDEEVLPKKVEKKKEARVRPSTSKSSINQVDVTNGVIIITGFYEELYIARDNFIEDTINETVLINEISNIWKEFTINLCKVKRIIENKYLVYFDSDKFLEEDIINDNSVPFTIRLSEFEEVIEEKVITLELVKSLWESLHPSFANNMFLIDEDMHVIVPYFHGIEEKTFKSPINISLFGKFSTVIEDKKEEIDLKTLKELLPEDIKELADNFSIVRIGENYFITPGVSSNTIKSNKKEDMYPTENTILSLAFIKFPLTPDLFKGKKEITKKELIRFLLTDYPEYSEERTRFEYDKNKNMIVAYLIGSRKGAELISDPGELIKKLNYSYTLIDYILNDQLYRIEKNSIGIFVASKEYKESSNNTFVFTLSLIPFCLLNAIINFFYYAAVRGLKTGKGRLEAACQIYYDIVEKKYFINYPTQYVSGINVEIINSVKLQENMNYLLVMDIHSHHIMVPTFSAIDDNDEKGTRLYAVVGNLKENTFDLTLRAGTGGFYIPLQSESIFSDFSPIFDIVKQPDELKNVYLIQDNSCLI